MAKINALPSLEVINTLKGTLDYYYWKGIPCVRKWPVIPRSSRTQASLDSAHLFGVIVQGWALVGATAKALYIEAAADQPRTGRDLYVSGVLGGQHEASMSDFLDLLTDCRDYLAALQSLLGPLGSVDTDDLQIDIKSALSTLPVEGQDQLFSFQQRLASSRNAVISGAGGYSDSHPVTAGSIWKVINIRAVDITSPTTAHIYLIQRGANFWYFYEPAAALAANVSSYFYQELWLEPTDVVRVYFVGGLAGDSCNVTLLGYEMTKAT